MLVTLAGGEVALFVGPPGPCFRWNAASRWPAQARKAKSAGHRLLINRHTLAAAPFGRRAPLIRLLLEVGIAFNYDDSMVDPRSFPRLRPSVSHAASRQAEIDRIRRMTVEERVKAALGLAARFAALRPSPREA